MGRLVVLLLSLGTAVGAPADYPAQREAAARLMTSGHPAEALAALLKLAKSDCSEVQRADALDLAVSCLVESRQYEQALALARSILLAPVAQTCVLRVLAAQRQWRTIIDQFGTADFSRWPEYLAAEVHDCRGRAYWSAGKGPAAVADLQQATRLLTEDNALGLACVALGTVYRDLLKDDVRSLAAYRLAYRTGNVYKRCEAALGAAELLRRQGHPDEALAELERIPLAQLQSGYWRAAWLMACGALLAQQGQPAAALVRYREALATDGLRPAQKAACEKAIRALAAPTPQAGRS